MMLVRKVIKEKSPRFKEWTSYFLLLLTTAVILLFFLQEEGVGTPRLLEGRSIKNNIYNNIYNNDNNNNNNSENHMNERRRTSQSTISDFELATCIETLEDFAIDGKINQEQFVSFIENFFPKEEDDGLTFDSFEDLPFPFILVFFTTACSSASGGSDCVNEEAAIPIDHVQSSSIGLLVNLCTSIKDLSAVQIEFPFQYRFQYQHIDGDGDAVEAQSLLSDKGINGINARDLENAIQTALIKKLTCSGDEDHPHRNHRQKKSSSSSSHHHSGRHLLRESSSLKSNDHQENSVIEKEPIITKQQYTTTDNILQRLKKSSTTTVSGKVIRKLEGHATDGSSVCDYTVHAEVVDASNFECQPLYNEQRKAKSDWNCALVTSKVIVTAASIVSLPTPRGFRSEIASILRDAINNNNILSFFS